MRWRHRCAHLLLKYSLLFGHTNKSNTPFESVKILCLFVCTHNNNKTLHFCKIMKQTGCAFCRLGLSELQRKTLCICLTDIKNISIESEMSTFKWSNWNGKQIFSDYVSVWDMHTSAWLLRRWRVSVTDFISSAENKESTSLSNY